MKEKERDLGREGIKESKSEKKDKVIERRKGRERERGRGGEVVLQ
jgi:hypothetical protein